MCEYRRCGAPLPPAVGRGSRARFCQDGKTWGRRGLNCRDAEAVLSEAESLRESDTELEDTAVTALAGEIDRVLEPARGLVDTLTTIREQLEATTAAALTARDDALAEADEHRRARGLAEAEAAQAREKAAEAKETAVAAEKERVAAVRDRDEEQVAKRAAVQDQQRAEGSLAAVRDELARVHERAEAATALAGERATSLAAVTAELEAARAAFEEEKGRTHAVAARAEAAELRTAATVERLETVRGEFASAVAQHQAALENARADTENLRAGFDRRMAELQAGHEQTVRSMHETATSLGAELRTLTARADSAERALAQAVAVIQAARATGTLEVPPEVEALLETS